MTKIPEKISSDFPKKPLLIVIAKSRVNHFLCLD